MGIYQLKERGHNLIDELKSLGMRLNGHRGIYGKLRRMLKVPEEKAHFSNMTKEWEVVAAVGALETMLIQRKKQKYKHLRAEDIIPHEKRTKPYLPDVYLSREDRLRAMAELTRTHVNPADGKVWIVNLL